MNKNPASIVASIVNNIARRRLLRGLVGWRTVMSGEPSVQLRRVALLPKRIVRPLGQPVGGSGRRGDRLLTDTEFEGVWSWMGNNKTTDGNTEVILKFLWETFDEFRKKRDKYNKNRETRARNAKRAIPEPLPMPSWEEMGVWLKRQPTREEEDIICTIPTRGVEYNRCQVGRDVFRCHDKDIIRVASTHRYMKMNDVKIGDDAKDFYGELLKIFEVTMNNGKKVVMFHGKWFKHVAPHDRSKTFIVEDPTNIEDRDVFASANEISGQILVVPNFLNMDDNGDMGTQLIVLDRTADFLECEEVLYGEDVTDRVTTVRLQNEPETGDDQPLDDENIVPLNADDGEDQELHEIEEEFDETNEEDDVMDGFRL